MKLALDHLSSKEFNDHFGDLSDIFSYLSKKLSSQNGQDSIRDERRPTSLVIRDSHAKSKEAPAVNFHGLEKTSREATNLSSFRESIKKVVKICSEWRKNFSSDEKLNKLPDFYIISEIVQVLETPQKYISKNKVLEGIQSSLISILQADKELYWKKRKADFKNLVVIKKCIDFRKKLLAASKCKICEEETPLEQLADHSFKCFARKSLHQELDRINRKIINKIGAAAKKTHTALRKNISSRPTVNDEVQNPPEEVDLNLHSKQGHRRNSKRRARVHNADIGAVGPRPQELADERRRGEQRHAVAEEGRALAGVSFAADPQPRRPQ